MASAAALFFCSASSSSSERLSSCCIAASALRCSTRTCRCFGGTCASVRSRTVMARLTILLMLLVLLAPARALAQDNPFGPIPQAPPQQTAPPEDDDSG